MSAHHFDIVVIGGGIVGLATAFQLLAKRPDLTLAVLEKESEVAKHQTGHNSGVIHSGLYYRPGSLKAALCVDGYQRLLEFCQLHDVPHEICGKVVVATSTDQLPQLDQLERRGISNGLANVRRLNSDQIREREPHCTGIAGLHIPQTGIVNYTAVCEKLRDCTVASGNKVLHNHFVTSISEHTSEVRISTSGGDFTAGTVITCGGLHSDRLARHTMTELDLRILPFRGEYFTLRDSASKLVRHLIYPVPNPNFPFLGVHFTRMIDGFIECGPNAVLAFAREGYKKSTIRARDVYETLSWPGFRQVAKNYWKTGLGEYHRSLSKRAFVHALQQLIPTVTSGDLVPAPAGVRAQACDLDGNLLDDFAIRESQRVLHVCNAPSPAATASLAIGDYLAAKVISRLH